MRRSSHRCSASAILLALGVLAGSPVRSVRADPADLAPLRAIYDSHLAQFESEYSAEMDTWAQDYRREVAQLVQASQRAGNLEAWQAATREVDRFQADPQIPGESPADAPEPVRLLQARYRGLSGQCLQRRFRKVSDLTVRYLARLETLKADATRAGRFEHAVSYNEEIRRVQALPIVLRAQEQLAAVSAAEAPAESTDSSAPAEVAEPAPPPVAEIPEGVVFSEGLTPPNVPATTFRPLPLHLTERMRVARTLSAQAELASSSESQRTSYSRSGSSEHVLRLWFRPSTSNQTVEGATLVAEFYGRNISERGSHIVPRSMAMIRVRLPRLDGVRWSFVQLPPLSSSKTVHRSSYYYSGSRQGLEFYGVVVSVFDAAGTLIHQGVSAANLLPLAPERMPEAPAPRPERDPMMPRPWAPAGAGME